MKSVKQKVKVELGFYKMDNVKNHIKNKLKNIKALKSNSIFKLNWTWILLCIVVIVGILFFQLLIVTKAIEDNMSLALKKGIALGFGMGIIYLMIIMMINFKYKQKKSKEIYNDISNELKDVYEVYQNENGLWNENIKLKKVIDINNMILEVNDQLVEWYINEDVEDRFRTQIDKNGNKVTYKHDVYILSYKLKIHSKKLDNISLIELKQKPTNKRKDKLIENKIDLTLNEFNQLFDIKAKIKSETKVIFTNEIMNNFIKKGSNFLGSLVILLENGVAQTGLKGTESLESYKANFFNFNNVDLKSKTTICDGVIEKIKKDFDTIQVLWEKFEPLELN